MWGNLSWEIGMACMKEILEVLLQDWKCDARQVFEDVEEALIIPVIAFGEKVGWKLLGKVYLVHGF
jgi:hypothetical protein